ncbi:MAG: hypothetical protein ACRD5F_04090 [Candidatus Acidiferrales bacterium]
MAQYVLYDEGTKKLYILEPQATAAQYAGQRVKITGTLGTTPLTRAGQSYAPDAVAAYKDSSGDPSVANGATSGQANGLRATAATTSTTSTISTTSTTSPTASAAISGQSRVQFHEAALDQTTPIAGTLTISSIAADPAPVTRRSSARKKQ